MLCTWKPVNTYPSNELNKPTSNSCHIQPPEALSYKATGCNHDGAVSGWQHNSICLKRRAPCAICRPILVLPNRHFHCFSRFFYPHLSAGRLEYFCQEKNNLHRLLGMTVNIYGLLNNFFNCPHYMALGL